MIGLIVLICLLPFIILYGLAVLAKLFESATDKLAPRTVQVPIETTYCTECGEPLMHTNWPGVCNECSRDWRG